MELSLLDREHATQRNPRSGVLLLFYIPLHQIPSVRRTVETPRNSFSATTTAEHRCELRYSSGERRITVLHGTFRQDRSLILKIDVVLFFPHFGQKHDFSSRVEVTSPFVDMRNFSVFMIWRNTNRNTISNPNVDKSISRTFGQRGCKVFPTPSVRCRTSSSPTRRRLTRKSVLRTLGAQCPD